MPTRKKYGDHADFRVAVSPETMAQIRRAQPDLDGHEVRYGDYLVVEREYVPASQGCMLELASTDPDQGVEEQVQAGEVVDLGGSWGYDHPDVSEEYPRRIY